MTRIAVLLFFALLVPTYSLASPGLVYVAVYMCNAVRMTEAVVSACTTNRPELSNRLATAFSSWRVRNAASAATAAKSCAAEVQKKAKNEEEFNQMSQKIEELLQESVETMRNKLTSNDATRCNEVLLGLESEKSDLDRWLPK